ncbi:endoplasmic reticulum metallopeptidase 1-like isoform X2 [Rhynchophorus ferrugineus]|uniref:endoplasmic reticulum metallopeptidase 1-like isoform X2 n=2 Tax=Rhynchophorus ferrugineus TaxID=354439 RepID=UPI003FCCBD96
MTLPSILVLRSQPPIAVNSIFKMTKKYKYDYSNPFNLDDMDSEKDSIHSVPFWMGLLIIFCLGLLFGFVFLIGTLLPTPLTVNDEANYPDSFIADRAAQDLRYLTDLGPKITGSFENEYAVVEYLSLHIKTIISEANPNQYIEMDLQEATGSYYLDDSIGFHNIYHKVQNVVVKIHGESNNTKQSILLNSHFDTVPSSPGASDDGINVVTMLEIIRKLSQREQRLNQNIIFLFNGAEETPLQAAHGFVAHHKWAEESKYLINLEACGSGGKIILFQTGPDAPWLVKYYSTVPHPYGNVIGEEVFQSGLIPSDTDFRLFRDFGNMVGADFAFADDGYRYHTEYDSFENIPLGSYQHVGDNILDFVIKIGNALETTEKERSLGKAVYFDIFGLFMITYSSKTAVILNVCTALVSILVFFLSIVIFRVRINVETLRYLSITTAAIVGSWLLAGIFVMILAVVLDCLGKTMSWYANPWTTFGLYIIPVIGISGCLPYFTKYKNFSLNIRGQFQAHLVRLIWTFVLIIGTAAQVRSTYFIMILILFDSFGFLLIHALRLQYTVGIWLIVHVLSLVLPVIYMMTVAAMNFNFFIPITGRLGSQLNPELLIAASALFFTIVITSPLTVLTNMLRKAIWYYLTLAVIFATFIGLLYTPFAFPYSADQSSPKPQRHWMMHTQRQFFLESGELSRTESGFFMLDMDRNSPSILKRYVKELADVESLQDDCEKYTFCGLPLIHPKVAKKLAYSQWIPSSSPEFPQNETLKFSVLSRETLSNTKEKIVIQVSGPDKLVFYITPKTNIKVLSTSLVDILKPSKVTFQSRPVYVLLHQTGKYDGTNVIFDVVVQKPPAFKGPALDIAVSGRYVHESRMHKTPAYLGFLNQFPQWTHVISWLSAYQSHLL